MDSISTPLLLRHVHAYLTRHGAHTVYEHTLGHIAYDTAWPRTRAVPAAEALAADLRDLMPLATEGETYAQYAARLDLALHALPGADPDVDRLEATAAATGQPVLVALAHVIGGTR